MNIDLRVIDAMSEKPIIIDQNTTIKEASKIMSEKNVSSLIITAQGLITGIITVHDVTRAVAEEKEEDEKVREIMTKRVVTIEPDSHVFEALRKMYMHEVNQLPVVSKNRLEGLVTLRDILRLQPDMIEVLMSRTKQTVCPACGFRIDW